MVALALERQHGVDDVLEHAGPGERAVLGDVADEHDRHAAPLGLDDQRPGRTRAPGRRDPAADESCGSATVWMLSTTTRDGRRASMASIDAGQRRLVGQPQVGAHGTEPLGAQADLLGALLGADVQRGARPPRQQLQQQRALADARLAAEQGDRPGDDARRRAPGRARRCRSAAARRAGRRCRSSRPSVDIALGRPSATCRTTSPSTSSTSVFHAPQPEHWPAHLGWRCRNRHTRAPSSSSSWQQHDEGV